MEPVNEEELEKLRRKGSLKKKLSQKLSVPRKDIFQLMEELGWENMEYFRNNPKSANSESFVKSCQNVIRLGAELEPLTATFQQIAVNFDFDEKTPGNGYRSLVCVADTTILHLVHLLRKIQEERNWMVFRSAQMEKELEAFTAVLQFLSTSFGHISRFQREYPLQELFPAPNQKDKTKDLLYIIEELDSSCFYGRALGFQYVKSVGQIFQVIGIALATYSVGWEKSCGLFGSLMNSGKLFLSPELRAQRIIHYVRHADVSFCKGFWNLSEGNLMQAVPDWFCPPMEMNEVQDMPADISLKVKGRRGGEEVLVPAPRSHSGPRPISFRILSLRLRDGMVSFKTKEGRFSKRSERAPRSTRLLFHCHGGGFVATSSKSHETYLRHWAKHLDCPLISVDYSLAPENPFPRAVEEVLYAYAWALNNPERLGWSGEKICFTGDSAGGNLLTAVTLRAIQLGFSRLPDGLVLAYTPFYSEYLPSPSRLLCTMDPLLPPGIILRCLAAYTNNLDLLDEPHPGAPLPFRSQSPPATERKSLKKYSDEKEEEKRLNGSSKYHSAESGSDEILSLLNLTAPRTAAAAQEVPSRSEEDSSSEEHFHTPTEDTARSLDDGKDSEVQFALLEDEEEEAHRMLWRQRSRSHSGNSDISSDGASEDSAEGPVVEIHRDPTRIWLQSNVCDSQLVDYLSGHRLTKGSLVVVEKSSPTKKAQLEARASVNELEGSKKPKKKKKLAPTFSGGHSRSKSMGSITKSFSAGLTGTVALATGHAYDQLSTWLHTPREEPKAGPEAEKNPLKKLRKMVVTNDMILSPMYATDEILSHMPPTHLVVAHMDPLLDDSICFGRKLRRAGAEVTLDLLDSLPHGFLNFTLYSPECRDAAKVCLNRIRSTLSS